MQKAHFLTIFTFIFVGITALDAGKSVQNPSVRFTQLEQAQFTLGRLKEFNPFSASKLDALADSLNELAADWPGHAFTNFVVSNLAKAKKCDQEAAQTLRRLIKNVKASSQLKDGSLDPGAQAALEFCLELETFLDSGPKFIPGGSLLWWASKNWKIIGAGAAGITALSLIIWQRKAISNWLSGKNPSGGNQDEDDGSEDDSTGNPSKNRNRRGPRRSRSGRRSWDSRGSSPNFSYSPTLVQWQIDLIQTFANAPASSGVTVDVYGVGCGVSQNGALCHSNSQCGAKVLDQLTRDQLKKDMAAGFVPLRTKLSVVTGQVMNFVDVVDQCELSESQQQEVDKTSCQSADPGKKLSDSAVKFDFWNSHYRMTNWSEMDFESNLLLADRVCHYSGKSLPEWLKPDSGVFRLAELLDSAAYILIADEAHVTERKIFADPGAVTPGLADRFKKLSVIKQEDLAAFQRGDRGLTFAFHPAGCSGHFVCARIDYWPDTKKLTVVHVDSLHAGTNSNPSVNVDEHTVNALKALAKKLLDPGDFEVELELPMDQKLKFPRILREYLPQSEPSCVGGWKAMEIDNLRQLKGHELVTFIRDNRISKVHIERIFQIQAIEMRHKQELWDNLEKVKAQLGFTLPIKPATPLPPPPPAVP